MSVQIAYRQVGVPYWVGLPVFPLLSCKSPLYVLDVRHSKVPHFLPFCSVPFHFLLMYFLCKILTLNLMKSDSLFCDHIFGVIIKKNPVTQAQQYLLVYILIVLIPHLGIGLTVNFLLCKVSASTLFFYTLICSHSCTILCSTEWYCHPSWKSADQRHTAMCLNTWP